MIGKTISHYKITEKLGSGGMGVVYQAEDTKLDRTVALKFLPPQLGHDEEEKQRFIHEAKAASALEHTNICAIHEIGETDDGQLFIVMGHYAGETLKKKIDGGPLSIEDSLDIAAQIAAGLEKAHEKGIVHRDIKPANIIITEDGVVKILDFGLAKLHGQTKLTKAGSTLGTAAYMSPEQAQGAEVDHRTDIFSLGAALYEMLTGEIPFRGDYDVAIIYSVLNEEPTPISETRRHVPKDVEAIVAKCLQKKPAARYQTAAELLADLKQESLARPARSPQKRRLWEFAGLAFLSIVLAVAAFSYFTFLEPAESKERVPIAVVDFVNQTSEPELDGLSGMLITALEQSRRLSVLSRARMYDEFKQMNQPNLTFVNEATGREISKRANISALAVATIRKFGQLYAIDFKVIDPRSGDRLFSTKVEGKGQESIPGMLDQLAEKTRIDLKEQENIVQLTSRGVGEVTTTNLKAYQHYFQGEQLINQLQFKKAQKEFKQAVALDSTFALAFYRLAYALAWNGEPGEEAVIQKAMQYVDTVPVKEQYMIRAQFAASSGDLARAITLYKDVLKLYPEEKEAIYDIGDYSFHRGDFSTAITYLEKVLAMDPLFERAWQHLIWTHGASEQYENQLTAARQYKERIPSPSALRELAQALSNNQDYRSAIQTYRAAAERFPDLKFPTIGIGSVYFVQENYQQAAVEFRKLLEAERPLSHKSSGYRALIMLNGHLGKYQEVLRLCDRLIELDAKLENSAKLPHAYALKAFWLACGLNDIAGAGKAIQKGLSHQNVAASQFYFVLFNTYVLLGEYDRATDLGKHVTSYPFVERVVNAHKQKAAGNLEAAIGDFKFLSEKVTGYAKSYNLAHCYFERGQNELAIQAAQRALTIAPNISFEIIDCSLRAAVYAHTFHLLGKIYEKKGDKPRAIENTEKFLGLWKDADPDLPDLIDAKERLARLKGISGK